MKRITRKAKCLINAVNKAPCETEAEIKQLRKLFAWIEEEYIKALGAKSQDIKNSDISI